MLAVTGFDGLLMRRSLILLAFLFLFQLLSPFQLLAQNTTEGPSDALSDQLPNLSADAQAAYSHQDYQASADLARRMTSRSPRMYQAWYLLGTSLLALHELDAAATALETAVSVYPTSPLAYNTLGHVYWQQRKYDEAIAQFRKQIAINPEDHYAHGNLGMLFRDQKECSAAVPELEKGHAITPNNPNILLALGECHIDLGDAAKGLSEMEQATSESSTPATWNNAAYMLAKRNLELERAQKWAETAIAVESTQLHDVSLDHLSSTQLSRVSTIANYWDTLGWIYFMRGNKDKASTYIEASWFLLPMPGIGYHLGEIYEALGRHEDATRAYAMAVVAADSPLILPLSPDDSDAVGSARQKLSRSAPNDREVNRLLDRSRADLVAARQVSVPNVSKISGSAEFTLNIVSDGKTSQVRQISGDSSFGTFSAALKSASLTMRFPPGSTVEIPRRGTLTCTAAGSQCHFLLLTSLDALDLSRKQKEADTSPALAREPGGDPHIYNNPAIGIRISLPDAWQLIREEPGTFTSPHSAMLGKSGAAAYLWLTRMRLEGSADLFRKLLDTNLSKREEFHRTGEMEITRDGTPGMRWIVGWKDNYVSYVGVMEFFSEGDDHYLLTALAPTEVYSRYSGTFEDMLKSAHFTMLHSDPKLLEKP